MRPSRQAGETAFALALVILSAGALWQAYAISGFTGAATPGVFPMLAAATMLISSAAVLVRTATRPLSDGSTLGATAPRRLMTMVGLILAFLAAMPFVGFFLAAGAFLFVSIAYLWRHGVLWAAAITLPTMILVWLTFRVAFRVVLPRGSLAPWLF